ncbi:MFS transporter [Arthrobacter rhizosphaerae]|uniref:MFS transporter n=1 Tax=Arthrobacter rhizosphaerae TaxID=2855490 RepID=UPI0035560AC4
MAARSLNPKPAQRSAVTVEPAPQLLLASQLIFNIGFYAVVPFLAVAMRNDFGMGVMAIGIVLGARTFAQQGLFLFGGALADRWGARQSMITGCLVRIAGFLLLAWAADFPLFLIGAIVTGIGGALFSPALQSLVGSAAERGTIQKNDQEPTAQHDDGAHKGDERQINRAKLFALLVVCGEVGVVVGPLLGSLLLNIGFDTSLLAGSAVFAVMALVFWLFLPKPRARAPKTSAEAPDHSPPSGLWSCLREKRFIGFAAFYSVNLLATNQLYFGLPIELERSGAGVSALAFVFAYASVLTITLQWPIARLMRKAGPKIALPLGFALQALGFASLAALAIIPPPCGAPYATGPCAGDRSCPGQHVCDADGDGTRIGVRGQASYRGVLRAACRRRRARRRHRQHGPGPALRTRLHAFNHRTCSVVAVVPVSGNSGNIHAQVRPQPVQQTCLQAGAGIACAEIAALIMPPVTLLGDAVGREVSKARPGRWRRREAGRPAGAVSAVRG